MAARRVTLFVAGHALAVCACGDATTAARGTDVGAPVDARDEPADTRIVDDDASVLDAPEPDAWAGDVSSTDAFVGDAVTDDAVMNDALGADAAAPDALAVSDAGDAAVTAPIALARACTDAADAVYVTPAGLTALTSERRGEVVRCAVDPAQSVDAVNANLRAAGVEGVTATWPVDVYRVAFRTFRDATAEGVSSARVFVPHGATGPRPMVVVAHPSEGLADACATSRNANGSRDLALPWATQGYPVIVPDLAGLGTDGTQGYLDNRDSAQSLLDGARALRQLLTPGSVSSRVVLVGYSQGGGVALAAQGLARTYGADGDVAAVVTFAAQWPSRLNSFQVATALRNPDALTISYGLTTPVAASSMAYVFFENHVGRGRGGEAFPAASRAATVGAINSLCLVAYGGFVQGTQFRVRDWIDPTLRTGFVACADAPTSAGCAGVGRDFYQYVRSNYETWAGGDPAGAPVLYVQGMLDTIMPPAQEAACNMQRLRRAGVDVELCTDGAALHSNVVERNMRHAMDWVAARLDGRSIARCTGPALPDCAP